MTKEDITKYATKDELKWLKETYDFMTKSPVECKECGSSDIETDSGELEEDSYVYQVHCNACGAKYEQRYNMTGREQLLRHLHDKKKEEEYKEKLWQDKHPAMESKDINGMPQEEKCPECGGSGQVPIGEHFVTRDMAIDAGEPEMEGMSMGVEYDTCSTCGGYGVIKEGFTGAGSLAVTKGEGGANPNPLARTDASGNQAMDVAPKRLGKKKKISKRIRPKTINRV
jgi:transcription elongation factor Elf1